MQLLQKSTRHCRCARSWSQSQSWSRRGKSQKLCRSQKSLRKWLRNPMCISEPNKVTGEQKYDFTQASNIFLSCKSPLSPHFKKYIWKYLCRCDLWATFEKSLIELKFADMKLTLIFFLFRVLGHNLLLGEVSRAPGRIKDNGKGFHPLVSKDDFFQHGHNYRGR